MIEGVKVRLRDITVHDLDDYAYWLQPHHQWQALDGPYYPKTSLEEIPGVISHYKRRIEAGNFPTRRERLVIADHQTNKLLGMVTCYWIGEETWWLALGIAIFDPAMWGKGIGYEAFGLWTDYQFKAEPKFVRMDLRTWSGNLGMMQLALKLGYQQEACFRKARIVNGEYYDGLGYGILREEWEARHPQGFSVK